MIFPVLKLENIVQVGDKTRLDATKSYVTSDEAAITLVEIETDTGDGFIDITADRYYDFQYSTDGIKSISLRVTTDGSPQLLIQTLTIITAIDDNLFSSDNELISEEPGILGYIKDGRNSYLDVHRTAQDKILKFLNRNKVWDVNGDPLTKDAVIDINEVNEWSKCMVLRLIFEGLSNATDDIFHEKALRYREEEKTARDAAILRLDLDGDGNVDTEEFSDMRSISLLKE